MFHFILDHGRLRDETLVSPSQVYFSKKPPATCSSSGDLNALSLRHILDAVSFIMFVGSYMDNSK